MRQKKVYKLLFDENNGDMSGLEVRMQALSVGQLLDMTRLTEQADRSPEDTERVFTDFAAALVGWNVEEEVLDDAGVSVRPVPPTLEGVRSCDLDFIVEIQKKWMEAIAGVPAPLTEPSGSGPQFPEGSLPMEPLSPSPPS